MSRGSFFFPLTYKLSDGQRGRSSCAPVVGLAAVVRCVENELSVLICSIEIERDFRRFLPDFALPSPQEFSSQGVATSSVSK